MKKVFLLLAFAFCATSAFASTIDPPESEIAKLLLKNSESTQIFSPQANCILCSACYTENNVICASGRDCETAAANLAFAFEALNCVDSE